MLTECEREAKIGILSLERVDEVTFLYPYGIEVRFW